VTFAVVRGSAGIVITGPQQRVGETDAPVAVVARHVDHLRENWRRQMKREIIHEFDLDCLASFTESAPTCGERSPRRAGGRASGCGANDDGRARPPVCAPTRPDGLEMFRGDSRSAK